MINQLYYLVPHITFKKKERYGFLWLRTRIVDKDILDLAYGEIILAENYSIAKEKYKDKMRLDEIKKIMKLQYINRKCSEIDFTLESHNTKWIKTKDVEEDLSFEEITLYRNQILKGEM